MMLHFIILGAQKAGSTYLQRIIGAHPDLYTPREETPFFQDPDYSPEGFEPMVARLEAAAPGKRVGIKRPSYLPDPVVPERIKHHAPDARLVAVLRDPRTRAVSAYFHLMRVGVLPIEPIEVGLPRILDGEYDRPWPASPTLLTYGRYAEHLRLWREWFPPEQLLVQFNQDIKHRGDELAREAFRHLQVDDDVELPPAQGRPMEGMYSPARQRFNRLRLAVASEYFDDGRRVRPRRNPVAQIAGKLLKGVDRLLLAKVFKARPPKLPEHLHRRLTDYYADDICDLQELTGRDLSDWLS